MKKRIYTLATVLLIAMLAISPVYAGGVSIKIGLGSIVVDVTAWGVGSGATAQLLSATGIPLAWCIDPGNNGNVVPGQNPSAATAPAVSINMDDSTGKGKFTAHLEDQLDFSNISPKEFGCPNNNWIPKPYFVQWTGFMIKITNSKGEWYNQHYTCETQYTGIDNDGNGGIPPTPKNPFDDGTIKCWAQ